MAEPEQATTNPAPPEAPTEAEDRRGALRVLVTVGSLAYAGALAVPAACFLASSGGGGAPRGARWVRVGRLDELIGDEPRRFAVKDDERDAFTVTRDQLLGSVWIARREGVVRAFSAACPHLGCSVDLAADHRGFGCPCHASRFGLDGAAASGPSPRGLDPLEVRVVDGFLEVDFRRFRQGVAERREASA